MDSLQLAIFALATWRLSSMLVREKGPWNLFIWIRERTGIQHEEDGTPYLFPDTTLAGVFSCIWCISVWVALAWLGLWLVAPLWAVKIATIFAISTGAILVDKWAGY